MKFYDIKNFKCSNCKCREYQVTKDKDGEIQIICSKCGQEITKEQYKRLEIKNINIK